MLLDVETLINDSKKISELRKRTTITKHQENSWIPMAQYNSRTNAYVNAAINLQSITSYNIEHAYSYIAQEFGSNWINLLAVGNSYNYKTLEKTIPNSGIASNIVAYTFSYTLQRLDWQIVNGSYIPDYYKPVHPDLLDIDAPTPMAVPNYDELFPKDVEDDLENNGDETETSNKN